MISRYLVLQFSYLFQFPCYPKTCAHFLYEMNHYPNVHASFWDIFGVVDTDHNSLVVALKWRGLWSILGWGEIFLSWKLGKKWAQNGTTACKWIIFHFRYIPLIFKISYTRLLHWWQVLKQFSRSHGANWLKISDKISLGRISLMLSPILASWVKTSEEMVRAKGKCQIFISTY